MRPVISRAGPSVRYLAGVLLLAAVYYGAGKASLALQYTGPVAALWLPVGVGAATLYLAGLRWVPGVIIGDLALADLSQPLGTSLAFTLGNTADIVVIAVLLQRLLGPRAALDRLQQVGGMLIAIVAGAAITATVAILAVLTDGSLEASGVPAFWRTWFLADASGSLVLIPLALAWSQPRPRGWRSRALEGALTLGAIVALSALALGGDVALPYIVFPALIWAALRFELRGATLGVAVAAVVAVGLTANEVGTFVAQSTSESVLRTQLYIAVAALTSLCLAAIVAERRQASGEARRLADEQAALRRVATLVAEGLQPGEEFAVVAEEAGRLLDVEIVNIMRFDPNDVATVAAAWSGRGSHVVPVGSSWPLEGISASALIARDGRPARVDDFTDAPGPIAAETRARGIRSTVGSPIVVEGRVWGAMLVESTRREPQPTDTEERLAGFTELVGTAIANAHAGAQVRRLADEQAALRRVATLVAEGLQPGQDLAVVAEEVGRLLRAEMVDMVRFDPGNTVTVVAAWSAHGEHVLPVGTSHTLDGVSASALIRRHGRSVRVDDFTGLPGKIAADARTRGIRSTVSSPIVVEGRVWGALHVESTRSEPQPADTEERLAGFTELVETAVANAHAGAEVRRLADEQAALRRVATLVAQGTSPPVLFAAVAEEVGRALDVESANVHRYDGEEATVVAGWSRHGTDVPVGTRIPLDVPNCSALVLRTGRPARIDNFADVPGAAAARVRALGIRSVLGAPILVEGGIWGVVVLGSTRADPQPADTERRLVGFTELVGTAIANAHAGTQVRRLADEQAALRRVATLVGQGVSPSEVFASVAEEVGVVLGVDVVNMVRHERDETATVVASWSSVGGTIPIGSQLPLAGPSLMGTVARTGQPARIDSYGDVAGATTYVVEGVAIQAGVGAPIVVGGRVWGTMVALSADPTPLPSHTEARLSDFTELVATAIGNAEADAEVRRLADEQAALRRVATLVARAATAPTLFDAVGEEVGRVLGADVATVLRYDSEDAATVVSGWGRLGPPIPVATQVTLEGENVAALVLHGGRSARMDSYADARGGIAERLHAMGVRSAVGAPIVVEDRIWGAVIAGSTRGEPLPATAESRIAEFTELVATAIANADSRAQLQASRARVVAAADEERRRIERNLHDGAQQSLVSLGVQLRLAEATVPADLPDVHATLAETVTGLSGVLAELQEISRGLHPAALARGGLEPALAALARRSTVAVELDVQVAGRLPDRVEVAAYYTVSEALTNAAKHARASIAHVAVEQRDGTLELSIRDDGVGGADPGGGTGLIGLRDRVEAIGGSLEVSSPPGAGTVLHVRLPAREPDDRTTG